MNLHIICTKALVGDHLVLKKDPSLEHQVESDDGGHLESIDALGPGRRIIIKSCNQALNVKRYQNIVPHFSQMLPTFR